MARIASMTADSPAACSRLERSLQSLFSNLSSDLWVATRGFLLTMQDARKNLTRTKARRRRTSYLFNGIAVVWRPATCLSIDCVGNALFVPGKHRFLPRGSRGTFQKATAAWLHCRYSVVPAQIGLEFLAYSWGPKDRSYSRVSNGIIVGLLRLKWHLCTQFKTRLVTSHLGNGFQDAQGGGL